MELIMKAPPAWVGKAEYKLENAFLGVADPVVVRALLDGKKDIVDFVPESKVPKNNPQVSN